MDTNKNTIETLVSARDNVRFAALSDRSQWPMSIDKVIYNIHIYRDSIEKAFTRAFKYLPSNYGRRAGFYSKKRDVMSALHADLESMPLLLTNESPDVRVIALWRLELGE